MLKFLRVIGTETEIRAPIELPADETNCVHARRSDGDNLDVGIATVSGCGPARRHRQPAPETTLPAATRRDPSRRNPTSDARSTCRWTQNNVVHDPAASQNQMLQPPAATRHPTGPCPPQNDGTLPAATRRDPARRNPTGPYRGCPPQPDAGRR